MELTMKWNEMVGWNNVTIQQLINTQTSEQNVLSHVSEHLHDI